MSNSFQSAFQFGNSAAGTPRDPEQPMRILVLANFAGRDAADAESALGNRKIQRVDIDNFEDILAKMRPTARVPLNAAADAHVDVEIGELDDFHPDNLYRTLPIFRELVGLRKRLLDPATFAQAAEKLREALPTVAAESTSESAESDSGSAVQPDAGADTPRESESDADTLDRVLGLSATVDTSTPRSSSGIDIQSLIDGIVAPYVLPSADPRQAEYVESIDAAVAGQLRGILHHESFQSLEATWRGLYFLVSQVATCEDLKVYILDVTKAELQQAGESDSGRLEDSLLFKRLVDQREQEPWSVLVSEASFGKQVEDLLLLSRLGAVAAQSGAPVLASADPGLLGCKAWTDEIDPPKATAEPDADSENWQTLRSSPVASWIGLSGPRFLLRMPYGAATDSIESFTFEEIQDPQSEHEALLWGAPSLLSATLIATSFLENQWAMSLGDNLELDDFPTVIFDDDGEKQLKACAEVYLSERIAESFLDCGVMPLLSYKNRNAIRLLRFQSIADPLRSLSGPWS